MISKSEIRCRACGTVNEQNELVFAGCNRYSPTMKYFETSCSGCSCRLITTIPTKLSLNQSMQWAEL